MSKSNSTRGGYRPGAGRKVVAPQLRKLTVNICLSKWVLATLDLHVMYSDSTRSKLIERALIAQLGLTPPDASDAPAAPVSQEARDKIAADWGGWEDD